MKINNKAKSSKRKKNKLEKSYCSTPIKVSTVFSFSGESKNPKNEIHETSIFQVNSSKNSPNNSFLQQSSIISSKSKKNRSQKYDKTSVNSTLRTSVNTKNEIFDTEYLKSNTSKHKDAFQYGEDESDHEELVLCRKELFNTLESIKRTEYEEMFFREDHPKNMNGDSDYLGLTRKESTLNLMSDDILRRGKEVPQIDFTKDIPYREYSEQDDTRIYQTPVSQSRCQPYRMKILSKHESSRSPQRSLLLYKECLSAKEQSRKEKKKKRQQDQGQNQDQVSGIRKMGYTVLDRYHKFSKRKSKSPVDTQSLSLSFAKFRSRSPLNNK